MHRIGFPMAMGNRVVEHFGSIEVVYADPPSPSKVRQLAAEAGYHELGAAPAIGMTMTFMHSAEGQLVRIFTTPDGFEPYTAIVQQTTQEIYHHNLQLRTLPKILQTRDEQPSSDAHRAKRRCQTRQSSSQTPLEAAVVHSITRLETEKLAVEESLQEKQRLLSTLRGAAPETESESLQQVAEPMCLTGTFVYVVVAAEALAVRKEASFSERTESFVAEGSLVACDRRVRVGDDIFVRLTDGRGWVFETKGGQRCLEMIDVEHGLFIYHAMSNLGLRNQPSTSQTSKIEGATCLQGHKVAADCVVKHNGNVFLRVRGGGWLFEFKPGKQGTLERMMERVELEYGRFIYEVTNSAGLALRVHPNHESEHVCCDGNVLPNGSIIASRIRVVGSSGNRCIYVEHGGKTGWLFASRNGERTMLEWASEPQSIDRSAGARTQLMIGPSKSWIVIFDFFDGELETQRRRWSSIPPGLAKQIENCYAKDRYVTGFAATSENDWYVSGQRLDGSCGHRWWSLNSWLDSSIKGTDDVRHVSMAYDEHECCLRQVVIFGTNGYATQHATDGLLAELKKIRSRGGVMQQVHLFPDDQWFVSHDKGATWVISNEHVTESLKGKGTARTLTIGPDGTWVVVFDRRFEPSKGVPEGMTEALATYFAEQNKVIDARVALIRAYRAALASLTLQAAIVNGDGWSMSCIGPGHAKYESVVAQFVGCWQKEGVPSVLHVLQIRNPSAVYARFVQYAKRCGNVCRRFHGTSAQCLCGHDLTQRPCLRKSCAVCNICLVGFSPSYAGTSSSFMRFGKGSYFSATSGKSNDYNAGSEQLIGGRTVRLMFLCKVAVGRAFRTEVSIPNLQAPPSGCNSVVGVPGKSLNFDEIVVYDDCAAIPSYLIAYSVHRS
jgi:hypothetical protein